jgi:hypothetical protein
VQKWCLLRVLATFIGGADEDFIRYQDLVLAKLREHEQHGGWLSMGVTDMDRDEVFTTAAALADRLQLTL